MEQKNYSLGDLERDAVAKLEPELRDHIELSQRAFNLAGGALEESTLGQAEVSQARKAAWALMAQLLGHLRCSALVAVRGYPSQACALAASVYEAAFTIMAIGTDDTLAQRWIDHDDPNRPFLPAKELTRLGLANFKSLKSGGTETEAESSIKVERNYSVYRQLCWPKHLNPLYVKNASLQAESGGFRIVSGPDTSDFAIRVIWYALEHGAGLVAAAVATLIVNYLPSHRRRSFNDEMVAFGRRLVELSDRAKGRWGTENPFPEKWPI